jgi:hypothetical protein
VKKPLSERLLARTERRGSCLIWTGTVNTGGYGQIKNEHGRKEYVHRVSHRLFIGPIPDGYHVDHVKSRGCEPTRCVEPAHLEAVTPRENVARSTAPGAFTIRTGTCPRGHHQTPENVYIIPRTGNHACQPCIKAKAAEAYLRRRTLQKEAN